MTKYLLLDYKIYIILFFIFGILSVKYIKKKIHNNDEYLIGTDFYIKNIKEIYPKDDITIVTALYKINSKYSFENYLNWVKNLLKINCSLIFFLDKSISNEIKNLRPKKYINKTIFIELEITNFISYKYFFNDFKRTYKIDHEKNLHSIPLYLVWAEKCFFVKRAIIKNYFKSSCFYWIDAGYFRTKNMSKYLNDWPSSKKCYEDSRIIMNLMRNITKDEIKEFLKLDLRFFYNFIKNINVGGGLFGGNYKNFIKFIDLYYKTIKVFIKKKLFIGKDQNLFAYISYSNRDIVKMIYSGDWFFFKSYLSK